MARGALSAVSRTLSDLYLVTHADRLRADPTTYLIGIALGVVSALVSAVIPAIEASRTPPATTLRQGRSSRPATPPFNSGPSRIRGAGHRRGRGLVGR